MKATVTYQAGNEQRDYGKGALTIHCSDVPSAFELGVLFSKLSADGKEIVHSVNSLDVFIRIPLTDRLP